MLITSCREKQTRFLQVVSDDTLFLHAAATALSLGGLLVEPAALAVLPAHLPAFDVREAACHVARARQVLAWVVRLPRLALLLTRPLVTEALHISKNRFLMERYRLDLLY
jgi:hypothetical protein